MAKGVDGRKDLTKLLADFYYKERQIISGDILGFNELEKGEKEAMRDMYSAAIVEAKGRKAGEEGFLSREQIAEMEDIESELTDSIERDEEQASAERAMAQSEQARLQALPPEARQAEEERRAIAEQGIFATTKAWATGKGEHSIFGTGKVSPLVYARAVLNELLPGASDAQRREQMQLVRDRLAEVAKQREVQRSREDLAAQAEKGEEAAKEAEEKISRVQQQAELEALSPEEERARVLRQQEGEHYGRLAYDQAIGRGLSREEAQAVGVKEQRAYHQLGAADQEVLRRYATGHVSSIFDHLDIAGKLEFQKGI